MVTYDNLSRRPTAFQSMTGMSVAAFDALHDQFAPAHAQRLLALSLTKRKSQPRQRRSGAGRRHQHDLRDRLLMSLVWLRIYCTYEVLGFFFSLNKTNVEDNLKDVLSTLEQMSTFSFELPAKERPKLRTAGAVMSAFPDVALVIDAKEQRIRRPKSRNDGRPPHEQQKPYYSGKKKAHTLKNEVGVRPDGLLQAVSQSVPGGATHDITLLRQTNLLERLGPEEAAMTDKGYDGIGKDHPDVRIYQPYKARRGHPLTEEQKAYNRHLSSYRIVVEHTLAQMNRFQVLSQVFRHLRQSHTRIVRVVAGLLNRQIALRPLKSYGTGEALVAAEV
jgi:hypothetical protein